MKTVVVQGLGFVGAVMATVVASCKKDNNPLFDVIGLDRDSGLGLQRIKDINEGKFPIDTNDDELKAVFQECYESKNLTATSDIGVFADADIIIVSINCDLIINKNGQKNIDLDSFADGIKDISKNMTNDTLIIIESTVPPGTCTEIIYPLLKEASKSRGLDINSIYLSHSYERVMPGKNYLNSVKNFWRVYSGINEQSAMKCAEFLSKIINVKDYPLKRLKNTIASESAKLLENSYRAVNIAFIDEWSVFAEDAGFDLFEVIDVIKDRPTHNNILRPGFGVGGYCLTKDPLFAKISAEKILKIYGHEFPFSSKAVEINNKMPNRTLARLKKYFDNDLSRLNILLLGITYKEDVADTRFSPSESFFKNLINEGANVTAHDPMIGHWDELDIEVFNDLPVLSKFNSVVLAVNHGSYKKINFSSWINNCKNILFFDSNNVLTKDQIIQIKNKSCKYLSIGRG